VSRRGRNGNCLAAIDVAILAGGMGTRTQAVLGNTPKVLAPIGGRPFLEILLDQLQGFGARRIILCLGHLADRVLDHIENHSRTGLEIVPVVEHEPLGTAGALRLARKEFRSDPVMALNGDTFVDANLCRFVRAHREMGTDLGILCARVEDQSRYASINIDDGGLIRDFVEKDPASTEGGIVSAGVYLFSDAMLDQLALSVGPSLEMDFFASLPAGTIGSYAPEGGFIDIGTPESLSRAANGLC
jgi:NDP-sugar pyrophosphorylase family protein